MGKELGRSRTNIRETLRKSISSENRLTIPARIHLEELIDKLVKKFNAMGVYCMTEKFDDILMWAHYADNHRGFCIEYERSDKNSLSGAKKVIYSQSYPNLSILDLAFAKDNALEISMRTKSKHWEYEREWRLTYNRGGENIQCPSPIKSVIFGMCMPPEHRKQIRDIFSGRSSMVYREAIKSKNRFAIEIRPC